VVPADFISGGGVFGGCLCVCFCTPATPAREPPSGFFFGRWQHMQYILGNKAMFLDSWGASISARGARWSACFYHFVDEQASWASRAGPPHKTRPWHGAEAALTAPPTQTLVPDILQGPGLGWAPTAPPHRVAPLSPPGCTTDRYATPRPFSRKMHYICLKLGGPPGHAVYIVRTKYEQNPPHHF
jgi:hypothetical protein